MGQPLPLFPLNTVLFPGVVLPLHIFEDRYRTMIRDLVALPPSEDRELGVVAIAAGFEAGDVAPSIQRVGCAGLLTAVVEGDDGTYEIVLVGRRRFQVEGVDPTYDYLRADVAWLDDERGGSQDDLTAAAEVARRLFDDYREAVTRLRADDVLEGETPTDPVDLSYTLAAAMVLPIGERQRLLECSDVASRLRLGATLLRDELRAIRAIPSLPATSLARTWSAS